MWWRRHPLVAGAVTLFLSGLFTRAVGTIYRILLVRTAGEAVLGIFQMTMPIYKLGWTLATLGLPVAIARLTADAMGRRQRVTAYRLRRVGLALTLYAAIGVALVFLFGSGFLAETILTDGRTRLPLALMGALLVPAALCASYRGALQGEERMGPVALSTAVEALIRFPVVLYLVILLLPKGMEWGASGIVLGLTIGEVFSLLVLVWAMRRPYGVHPDEVARTGRLPIPSPRPADRRVRFHLFDHVPLSRRLLKLGLPVSGAGLLNNLLSIASVALIPRRLGLAGFTMDEAIRLYGRLSGMALPLLYMPMVAVQPIVQVVIPSVSSRFATGGRSAVLPLIRRAFLLSFAVGCGAAAAFLLLPDLLTRILYGVSDLGSMVRPLAFVAPFAYVGHVAAGILYGLGKTGTVMIHSAAGNLIRLGLIWHLASQPEWGIYGVLIGSMADYMVTAVLNTAALLRMLRRR